MWVKIDKGSDQILANRVAGLHYCQLFREIAKEDAILSINNNPCGRLFKQLCQPMAAIIYE